MSSIDAVKQLSLARVGVPEPWGRSVVRLQRPLVAAGLLLVVALLLYGVWLLPLMNAVRAQEAQSHAARQQLQELFLHQQAEEDLADVVPSKKELPQVIGRVSALGRRAGVSIPGMAIQPVQTASPQWAKVNLQFIAHGTYGSVRRFLAALEGADEPFVVESLSLAKDRQSDQIVAPFTITVYARDG